MKTIKIFTNGISFFTLENYSPSAASSEANGISFHKEVSKGMARAMHANGSLHYIFGYGDRKVLKGAALKRGMKLSGFEIH